jgi:hypothetical protein
LQNFAKFFCEIPRNFLAKFREIIHTKFREIDLYFRINFVFREIKKGLFVSTLGISRDFELLWTNLLFRTVGLAQRWRNEKDQLILDRFPQYSVGIRLDNEIGKSHEFLLLSHVFLRHVNCGVNPFFFNSFLF